EYLLRGLLKLQPLLRGIEFGFGLFGQLLCNRRIQNQEEIITLSNQLISDFPHITSLAFCHIAEHYFAENDFCNSAMTIERGLSLFPDDHRLLVTLLRYYVLSDNTKAAEKLVEKMSALGHQSQQYLREQARYYLHTERPKQALALAQNLFLNNPANLNVILRCYLQLDLLEDLVQAANKYPKATKADPRSEILVAQTQFKLGNEAQAKEHLLHLWPMMKEQWWKSSREALGVLVLAFQLENTEIVEQICQDIDDHEEILDELSPKWAQFLHRGGNPQIAEKIWNHILPSTSHLDTLWTPYALTLLRLNRPQRAKAAFSLAMKSRPKKHDRRYWYTERLGLAEVMRQNNDLHGELEILSEMYAHYGLPHFVRGKHWPSIAFAAHHKKSFFERIRGKALQARHKISVIMAAFNAADDIETAINSIAKQTYSNFELIIVDDESTDNTVEIIERCAKADSRITLIKNTQNAGPYVCKNMGLEAAKGDIVTFHDADDISHPCRLEFQLRTLLRSRKTVGSICHHVRLDNTNKLQERGMRFSTLSPISLMFRKERVLKRIGYFDSVRAGGDSEFIWRLMTSFGKESLHEIYLPLYYALVREGSLTMTEAIKTGELVMSLPRRMYKRAWTRWHEEHSGNLRLDYPLMSRPYAVPEELEAASLL
ncbi:MAG: glycosyltransferase, partial [Bdellovibrionales bacterium]|nr:glycosyltransferase [Bdellovibrionales bacterium]